ncbi:MAG: hypothetical protein KAS02_00730 [Candidatus Pacebacteria bacterium]|nr:hypothetical protein [Candidatus Paceibacterota bacterium]
MNKKLQDVTPPKRTIHDIPVPNGKGRGRNPISDFKSDKKKKTSFSKKIIIAVIFGLIAFLLFSFLASSSVTVNVISRQLTKRTDASFIAVSSNETGGIPFDVVMLDKTIVESIVATGEEEVNEKASGEIIVFNNFDFENQRLIKNTRFETSEGLVFRIQNSVVVPGQKEDSSGEVIPGSIEVTVYADQPGEEYNVGLKDFTIPGFEGTERFDKFYARSKTVMAGGFEGVKKVASEKDVENMQIQLGERLIAELTEEIKTQIPEGFVLYQNGIFSETKFLGTKDMGDKVGVEEKVNVYAVIFNRGDLSKYVAENIIDNYDGADLIISNLDNLDFEIKNKDDVIPWVEERFVFSLKGECNFEWTFDEDDLKNDFVGKSKSSTNEILSRYPSIDSAEVIIKPFWKNSFPRSTGNIEIVLN